MAKERNMTKGKKVTLYNTPIKNAMKKIMWFSIFVGIFIFCFYVSAIFSRNTTETDVIMPFIIALIIHLGIYIYIKYRNRDLRRIEKKLNWFIYSNNLYTEETFERAPDKDGKVKRYKKVIYSVTIFYRIHGGRLYIECAKDGNKKSSNFDNLEDEFTALFGLDLEDVKNGNNYVLYVFTIDKERRLNVTRNGQKQVITENGVADYYANQLGSLTLNSHVEWEYSKLPHALIAGNTGGGKTFFINYLVMEFLKDQAEVFVCDAKMSDLYALKRVMPDKHVASTEGQIAQVMRLANEKMEERYAKYIEGEEFKYGYDYLDHNLSPIVVFFDEIGAFKAIADKKVAEEVNKYMRNIILKGRQMGVFMILSTQQPNADNIPTEIRDMMGLRVSLGNMSKQGYTMIFGDNYDLKTVDGKGHGYYFIDGLGWERPREYFAPFIDKYNVDLLSEIENLVKANGM
ncbi:FtsK/SpoIIIE domain-containing protein [Mammaliicoccus sp. M-M49]|uniref:FtsK/SpoIIIE domain-containing protein n=1 Tax=Mammaliicoccus sp. M-M49 TaxID=2898708 RepID=UPI001EFAB564|nr:FtsK/SpoIIIE domain-containing protein [Mammaliicoccus sp. M-M49]